MIFEGFIKEKKQVAKDTWEVTISHYNDLFYFNAGQYIWIITESGRRAFSICSSSKDPFNITILFRDRNKGQYKRSILALEPNQKIKLRGPCGVLRVPEKESKSVYVVGGVGIAPVMSILESLVDSNLNREISLIFINHDKEHEFCIDKLEGYKHKLKSFKYVNYTGEVSSSSLGDIDLLKGSNIYILGSPDFITKITSVLKELNINQSSIVYEENFPNTSYFNVDLNDGSVFKQIVDQSANHVIITDSNGIILYANKSAEVLTGFSFEEMKGQTPRLWGGEMDPLTYEKLWNVIKNEKKPFRGEFTNVKKDGTRYDVIGTISPILDKGGILLGFMGIEEDISQTKKDKIELEKISNMFLDKMIGDRQK